ncbi:MAG: FAD binding domain-containing protein [Deltaproteobacteria bacterium]|nr:FAD binding domain-containing protein [Deltaproteobacteria bacterium]
MITNIFRPQSVAEALGLKNDLKGSVFYLAGGTEINSKDFYPQPDQLIFLEGLGLNQIQQDNEGLTIGAHCTMQQLIDDTKTPDFIKQAAAQIINRNIRNAATLGGHLVCNKPYSDIIPTLLVAGASVEIEGPQGTKVVLLSDFLQAPGTDLLVAVKIPQVKADRRVSCLNYRCSANDLSLITTAVSVVCQDRVVSEIMIILGGVGLKRQRLLAVENNLISRNFKVDRARVHSSQNEGIQPRQSQVSNLAGRVLPGVDELQNLVSRAVEATPDFRGSVVFKKYEAGVMVAQALCRACEGQAGGGS